MNKFTPALGFDGLTGFYDLAITLTMPEQKFRTKLIDELAPARGEAILEFGYGTAQNLILIQRRHTSTRLTGVDIDPKVRRIALHKLKRRGLSLSLDLYDGETLPYADNSFDKVFSSLVFHQLTRDTKLLCLKEIYRVLRPGGTLVIGDWGKPASRFMRWAFYIVQLLDGFKTTADNVKGYMPVFMKQAGFRQVAERGSMNTRVGTYCYYRGEK